jgi:hypothetical protein
VRGHLDEIAALVHAAQASEQELTPSAGPELGLPPAAGALEPGALEP